MDFAGKRELSRIFRDKVCHDYFDETWHVYELIESICDNQISDDITDEEILAHVNTRASEFHSFSDYGQIANNKGDVDGIVAELALEA